MKFLLLVLGFALLAGGALAADEVDVSSVKFANVRAPGGATANWLEADIALNVRPATGIMVSRVRVSLTIGCELPATAGGERRVEYYRSEAECVGFESGRSDVRFYLPPELVKRDQLHSDPKFWLIAVTAAGREQSLGRGSAAPALATMEARKHFAALAAAGAPVNDGLLLPQFLTPFAIDYPRATPSFVRHGSR